MGFCLEGIGTSCTRNAKRINVWSIINKPVREPGNGVASI